MLGEHSITDLFAAVALFQLFKKIRDTLLMISQTGLNSYCAVVQTGLELAILLPASCVVGVSGLHHQAWFLSELLWEKLWIMDLALKELPSFPTETLFEPHSLLLCQSPITVLFLQSLFPFCLFVLRKCLAVYVAQAGIKLTAIPLPQSPNC